MVNIDVTQEQIPAKWSHEISIPKKTVPTL
jgi:hypothetical protein